MNELSALKEFRAEREAEPPEAREAIWRALEARIEAAAELAAPPAGTGTQDARRGRERPGSRAGLRRPGPLGSAGALLAKRRRALAFAGATLLAAIVAGALVLGSGPTAQQASAAEILHEAATAAAASDAPATLVPGPGQYNFRKEERLNIAGWVSPVPSLADGIPTMTTGEPMGNPHAYNAVVPTTVEMWTAADGGGRVRETLGDLRFWSDAEEARWKAAGSPLPPPFNPEYQRQYATAFRNATHLGERVVDFSHDGYGASFHFPDTSKLPTDPRALREAVEANAIEVTGFNLMYPKAQRLNSEQATEELLNVLFEGTPSPALQAAIFNALAEVPGIEIGSATDALGRHGDVIALAGEEGARREYIFDAETGSLLASRGVLLDPAASRNYDGIPAGTTIGERDFIATGLVDSTSEAPAEPGGAAAN
jgi:hypothetical protein